MLAVLAFVIVLGLLVFVHEAGHFIVAKRAGMGVEEFGFGFPPRLIGFQKRDGRWRIVTHPSSLIPHPSTIYSLNWIPLGGFVRIAGENGDASDPMSFAAKPRWQRAVVLLAGVAMNLVLAVVLFTAVATIGAPQVLDGVPAGAHIRDRATRVVGILPSSPAASAGLQPGDAIAKIDGQTFTSSSEVQAYIRTNGDRVLTLEVRRDGVALDVRVQPAVIPEIGKPGLGVQLVETGIVSFPIHRALWHGIRTTGAVLREILSSLGQLVSGLVREQRVAVDIAGPVGIAVMTGQVVQLGFVYLLQFAAVLSSNLALLNVFPFPALDGGRLLFLAIEAIRRRPLGKQVENIVHGVGYAVLLLLVLVVTYHDVATFGGGILSSIRTAVGL